MKIYDLTCIINEEMWFYGSPYLPFTMEKIADIDNNGYIARELKITTHHGTHVECQAHWQDDGQDVASIPLDKICGKAKVIRFEDGCQSFYTIDEKKLKDAGAEKLEPGDICILNTNWDNEKKFPKYVFESPFITIDGAEYLSKLGVSAVAFDFPICGDPRDGMDFVPSGTKLPDTILYDHGIPTVVGLIDVDKIPDEVFLFAAPLKISGADGSPIRAMAIEI